MGKNHRGFIVPNEPSLVKSDKPVFFLCPMAFSNLLKEFFYSLSATDKYSDFDSRKSFNRVNKPNAQTSLLYSNEINGSSVSLNSPNPQSDEGVHETRLAWRHIKKWLHKHSPDLNSTLLSPCTKSDLSEFQKDLDIRLPKCVLEFFSLTDGQSTFNENGSGGIIYGLRLMSINEIAVMTTSWRNVQKALPKQQNGPALETALPVKNNPELSYPSELKRKVVASENAKALHRFPNQNCVPPGSILPTYAHSMWIPIITDGAGNCIAIDLSHSVSENVVSIVSTPADTPRTSQNSSEIHENSVESANTSNDAMSGNTNEFTTEEYASGDTRRPTHTEQKWGQVIIFGRDFDTKYKIADTFGDFLLMFANDLEKGNWELTSSSDSEDLMCGSDTELIYVDHSTKKESPYLDVLSRRATDQWLKSLSEEQKELKENKELLDVLNKKLSFQNLEYSGVVTDSLINDNLRTIDAFNTPIQRTNEGRSINENNGGSSNINDGNGDLDDDMK